MRQAPLLVSLFRVKSKTEMVPSPRLEMYISRESRLTYSPWQPLPVGRKDGFVNLSPSRTHTPLATMSAM